MTQERCENCRFFYKDNNTCRRHPPVLLRGENCYYSDQPNTGSQSWCGEWQPNQELKDTKDKE